MIVDRRKNFKGKSSPNRRKFIERVDKQIKGKMPDMIDSKGLSDDKGVDVVVDGIDEPSFSKSSPYDYKIINGNDQFTRGDKIPKRLVGKGNNPGDGGFERGKIKVRITKEEFFDYFFDDMELPNIEKINMHTEDSKKYKRSGFSKDGTPNRLDVVKSFRNKMGRDLAIAKSLDKKIEHLKKKLKDDHSNSEDIKNEIERLKKIRNSIPFMINTDLQYTRFEKKPVPSSTCKVIFIMDVSGSMSEDDRRMAKSFFMLLYIFLNRTYNNVGVYFIRHTGEAELVDEKEFFGGNMTGGTRITPAMKEANKVIQDNMNVSEDNIYIAQCTDGEVFSSDTVNAIDFMKERLLPKLQYMWYLQINHENSLGEYGETLYDYYRKQGFENFSQQKAKNKSDIWKVFKKIFKK